MLVQPLLRICGTTNNSVLITALFVDWGIGITLFAIGIIGVAGFFSPAVGYACLGGGCVYLVGMVISSGLQIQVSVSPHVSFDKFRRWFSRT